jgi:hypothetical protein
MSDMKPLCAYVLFATTADKKYIKIDNDGCLAIFEDKISAKTAKKLSPGSDFVKVNYYTEKQVEQLKARVTELEASLVVPKGYKLMPIVSTTVMDLAALASRTDVPDEIWRLMGSFAPAPPSQKIES